MARKYVTNVKKWMDKKELVGKIKDKKVEARILQRLLFIKYLYEGDSVPEAADKVEVTLPVAYAWRSRWNEQGYNGLIPRFDGGAPSKLSQKEKESLISELKLRDDWTTKEIRQLIQDKFNVSYTDRHVNRLLKSFGMNHGKPFQQDYRRPDNAEEQLKKTSMKHSRQ
jgi:putative transposase